MRGLETKSPPEFFLQNYDVTLKLLLQSSADSFLRQLAGVKVARWLNVEFPQVQLSRGDLLGATTEDGLLHLELQATNDSGMAVRMAEYALRIYTQFSRFANQIVLYVGDPSMRMERSLRSSDSPDPEFAFRFTLIDIRELDTSSLLSSSHIEDNLLAILTRLQDQAGTVREILRRIAELDDPDRRQAFERFLIISGLRRLAPLIKQEAEKMPILNDIMDHEVIGPAIRQGLAQGLAQGLEQGRDKGHRELLRLLLEKRFGTLPEFVENRLTNLSASQVDEMAIRFVDATRLEELFPKKP
jgi:predicted transposase YdaD